VDELQAGALYFDGDDAAAVLDAWAIFAETLPEHANTSVALLQLPPLPTVPPPLAGRLTVAVRFASPAGAAACAALLAPLRAVAEPLIDTVGPLAPADLGAVHADPVEPMPNHDATAMLHRFDANAAEALLAVAGPGSGSVQTVVELRRLGGALARPATTASAFCHRDAAYSLMVVGVLAPPVADAVPGHAAQVLDALRPWSTGAAMPNFLRGSGPERAAACYDEHTRTWLMALADRYDPDGVLRVGAAVRHAA
jgi:hypothetical protein